MTSPSAPSSSAAPTLSPPTVPASGGGAPRLLGLCLALLAIGPATGEGLLAQIPGGDHSRAWSRREAEQARLRAEALSAVQENLQAWADAWVEDDLEALAEAYTEDAVVLLPGSAETRVGRGTIRRAFEQSELLGHAGDIQLRMLDFDREAHHAFGLASYRFYALDPSGRQELRTGKTLMVLIQDGRDWRIRSQVFQPGEGENETTAEAAG